MSGRHRPCAPRLKDHGVALPVVLVAMVALSFTALAAMKSAANTGQVAVNLTAQAQARESAHTAIRYCERILNEEPAAITVWPAPTDGARAAWAQASSWAGADVRAESVPWALLRSPAGEPAPAVAPQCLVESIPMKGPAASVMLITARGFSPDFTQDAAGLPLSGAIVWEQAVVALPKP